MLFLTACNNDNLGDTIVPNSENSKIQQPGELEKKCSFVDNEWSPSSFLTNGLQNYTDTNFLYSQLTKIANMWGRNAPSLNFVNDLQNSNSTNNAVSYSNGRIYYGYALYYRAKSMGGDIVNAMIMAHEYGHQLQYIFGLPSVRENSRRSNELEADGFAGYYLRRPNGYNKTDFSQIASAYEFAYSIGDSNSYLAYQHGTSPQRRSAVRLGFLLGQFNLSAAEFDSKFFYYYQGVLNGNYKLVKNIDSEIDVYMSKYMGELRKIQSGEISAEEFKKL